MVSTGNLHCKNIRISRLKCGPELYYSVDLWIQTYTEPVPLKCEKFAKNIRAYTDIFTVYAVSPLTILLSPALLSLHSTGPTPTPTRTSSPTSSRGSSACQARAEVRAACRRARGSRPAARAAAGRLPRRARQYSSPRAEPTCPQTFIRRALFLEKMSVGDARVYTCT